MAKKPKVGDKVMHRDLKIMYRVTGFEGRFVKLEQIGREEISKADCALGAFEQEYQNFGQ